MREAKLVDELVSLADARGYLAIKQSPMGDNGWPDWLVLADYGVHGFIELKRPGKEPTVLQHHRLAELTRRGHLAVWANSLAGVHAFIRQLDGLA